MKKSAKVKLLKKFESYLSTPQIIDCPDLKILKVKPFIKQISKILNPEPQTEKLTSQLLIENPAQPTVYRQLSITKKRRSRMLEAKSDSTMSSFHCNFGSEISKSPVKSNISKQIDQKLEKKGSEKLYRVKSSKISPKRRFKETIQQSIDEYFAGVNLPKSSTFSSRLCAFCSLEKHRNSVNTALDVGNKIWTAGSDYEIRTWVLPDDDSDPYKSSYYLKVPRIAKSSILNKHSRPVTCLTSLSSGVLSSALDGTVKLWSTEESLIKTFHFSQGIKAVLYLNESKTIFGGCGIEFQDLQENSKFHDAALEESSKVLEKHTNFTFFSAGNRGVVKLWDIRAPRFISKLSEHFDEVTGLIFRNDFEVISCGLDGFIRMFDLRKRESFRVQNTGKGLTGMTWDQNQVFVAGENLLVWDKNCEQVIDKFDVQYKWVKALKGKLYCGGLTGVVDIWDIKYM